MALGAGETACDVCVTRAQRAKRRRPRSLVSSRANGHLDTAPARLQNEHIVKVMDVGMLDSGSPCFVMEYLEGVDLKRLLALHGPLEIPVSGLNTRRSLKGRARRSRGQRRLERAGMRARWLALLPAAPL